MYLCGVDVVHWWLSDWTRLQWARPFCAMRGDDAAIPILLSDFLLLFMEDGRCKRDDSDHGFMI